jgi:hypothetical protein
LHREIERETLGGILRQAGGEAERSSRPRSLRDSPANGGVPPFGHTTHLRVFIDPDLLQYDEVWAAAGSWHDVFGIEPHTLVEASEGLVTDLKRGQRRSALDTLRASKPSRS